MRRQLNIFKHPAVCRQSTDKIHFHIAKLIEKFIVNR